MDNNKLMIDSLGSVLLTLKGKGVRNIGSLSFDGDRNGLVYQKFEDSIFEKFNAFGFCNEVIKRFTPKLIKIVWVGGNDIARGTYTIGINTFRENIRFLNFKNKGLELRCYVPVDNFLFRREG